MILFWVLLFILFEKYLTHQVNSSRAAGDAGSAVKYFEESVEFLSRSKSEDMEVAYEVFYIRLHIGFSIDYPGSNRNDLLFSDSPYSLCFA